MKHASVEEELEQESFEETLTEPTILVKPFIRIADPVYEGVWSCPVSVRASADRTKLFAWDRPKTARKNLVESASKYQAVYLQKMLKDKDREMKLITNQLIKSNKENVSLLRELQGYRGKNYDGLRKENLTLKEHIARACRVNALLAGQWKKDNNCVLHKFNKQQRLCNTAFNQLNTN